MAHKNPQLRSKWPKLRCDQTKIIEISISSSTNITKHQVYEILLQYLGPFRASSLKDQIYLFDIRRKNRSKLNNFCFILFNKIFTSDVICLLNEPFSNIPTLPRKIEKVKRKPMCTTTMYLIFKFIWFHFLALALSERLSGNHCLYKLIKELKNVMK